LQVVLKYILVLVEIVDNILALLKIGKHIYVTTMATTLVTGDGLSYLGHLFEESCFNSGKAILLSSGIGFTEGLAALSDFASIGYNTVYGKKVWRVRPCCIKVAALLVLLA